MKTTTRILYHREQKIKENLQNKNLSNLIKELDRYLQEGSYLAELYIK